MKNRACSGKCIPSKIRYFLAGIALLAVISGSSGASRTISNTQNAPALDQEERTFLTLINNFRAQHGAGPLRVAASIKNSSRWMAHDMAMRNYMSHRDSLGRDPGTRMAAFGYSYLPTGENIAAGYVDAKSVFNGWATACDPDASGRCTYAHRNNMLDARFTEIGISRDYNRGSRYGWFWATDFGGRIDLAMTSAGSHMLRKR